MNMKQFHNSKALILLDDLSIDCPLAQDTLCHRVYKIKVTTDLRKYTALAHAGRSHGRRSQRGDPEDYIPCGAMGRLWRAIH